MYENDNKSIKKAQEGDKNELEKLLNNNNGLIWSIVRRFQARGYEVEDLYQIACMGFIKAVKRFDTNFEVKLTTYAVPYMIGEIKKYIRDDGLVKVSRSLKDLYRKVMEVQKEYIKKEGKEPTLRRNFKNIKNTKGRDYFSFRS